MTRPIGALIFALVLAIPCLAEAECAWVLWGWDPLVTPAPGKPWKFEPRDRGYWQVKAAFETRRECEAQVIVYPDGSVARSMCLPDTIDPRGPKGGGR